MPTLPEQNPFENMFGEGAGGTKPKVKSNTPKNPFEGLFETQAPTPTFQQPQRELDQFGLPKSYLSAAPAGMIKPDEAPKESFWTKAAKTVLPKKLEDFFGLNKSPVAQQVEKAYEEKWAYEDLQRLNKELEAGGGKLPTKTGSEVFAETKPEKYIPFLSAVPDIVETWNVYQSAKRLEKGENTIIDDYRLARFSAEAQRDKTFMAKVSGVLTELPSFGGELLLTGGIYTAGKKVVEKGVMKTAQKAVGETAGRIITKTLANVVGSTAQFIPARIGEITAGTIANMTPGYSYQADEAGTFSTFLNEADKGENFWNAAKLSLGDQWVEVVSEHSGGIFGELASPAKAKLLKIGLFNAFIKANPNATSNMFMQWVKRAGWNGTLVEIGEERIGEALRGVMTPLGLSKEGYKLPSKEQLAVELVSFAVPGVMIGASNKALERFGGTIETPPTEGQATEPKPITEANNIIGARDILIAGRGGKDVDADAMAELNTTINNYHNEMASPVIEVLDTDRTTLADIKVVPYPDGKWGFSYEINTPEHGVLSDFLSNKIVKSREEAVALAKAGVLNYAQGEVNNVSAESKTDFENIIKHLERVEPSSDVPIEVRKQQRDVAKPMSKEDELVNELQTRIMSGDTEFIDKMKERAKGNPKLVSVLADAIATAQAKADEAKNKVGGGTYTEEEIQAEVEKMKKEKASRQPIENARDAAKNLIRAYVERGDDMKSLNSLGVASSDYWADVESGKVVVSKLKGKELDKPEKFNLKELYDEIKGEKTGTQKEKVAEAVKEKPKTIKEIAEETKILEPNVRRILGVGAKEGTFARVDKGVYVLTKGDKKLAYIETGDAVEVLPRLAKEGMKADMIFLDIPYKTPSVTGGNRGAKFEFITVEQFGTIVEAVKDIARYDETPVFYMYSQAPSGVKEMQKYTDKMVEGGFKPVARGEYTKLQKDGITRTRNMRGQPDYPEGIILFTKSGVTNLVNPDLNFKLIRPKGYQTEKPAELAKALIEMSTKEGEVVLDPFAGSGVVPAEAVKAGREAVAVEKSEKAVEEFIKPRLAKASAEVKTTDLSEKFLAIHAKAVAETQAEAPARKKGQLKPDETKFVKDIKVLNREFQKETYTQYKAKYGEYPIAFVSLSDSEFDWAHETAGSIVFDAGQAETDPVETSVATDMNDVLDSLHSLTSRGRSSEIIQSDIQYDVEGTRPAEKTEVARETPTPRFGKPTQETAKPMQKGKKAVPAHEVAVKIIAKRPSLPILGEFKVKDGVMTATDLEVSLQLNSDLADGMYRVVGKDAVKTETDPADFPIVPEIKGEHTLKATTEQLSQTLKSAVLSTSDSDIKPELQGVHFKTENGRITVASTDAYRMFMKEMPAKVLGEGEFIMSNPEKVQKVISAIGDLAEITIGKEAIKFEGSNGRVVVRKVDGGFPEYKQIIPAYTAQYSMEKPRLLSALKEMKPYAKEIFNNAVKISFKDNKMTLLVDKPADKIHNNPAVHKEVVIDIHGQNKVDVLGRTVNTGVLVMPIRDEGKGLFYNINYLIDALNALEGDAVYLYTGESPETQPAFISNERELRSEIRAFEAKDLPDYEYSTPFEEAMTKFRQLFDEHEVGFIINNDLMEKDFAGQWQRLPQFGWRSREYSSLVQLVAKDGKISDRVMYHEAFHAYFNTFLSKRERDFALKTIRDNFLTAPARALNNKEVYDTEDKLAEEWLADDFARYVADKNSIQHKGFRGFYEKILNRLLQWIRKEANIEKIYDDILSKTRDGVYSTDPSTRAFAIAKQKLDRAISNDERISLVEQLLADARQEVRRVPSGFASAGAKSIGTFEDLSGIENKTAEELKLFEEVKALVEKYAKSIGEDYTPRKALGVYYPNTTNIRIKGMNDVSVAAHEITHFLDFAYKLSDQLQGIKGYAINGNPIYESETYKHRQEMSDVYEQYYPGGKPTHKLSKRMIEGFATLLQKYAEQPSTITAQFPNIVKDFLTPEGQFYHPVMGDIIKDLRAMVAKYQGLPALDKIGARVINDKVDVNKDSFLNFWQKFKTEVADNVYPIELLAKQSGQQFTKNDPSLWVRQYNNSSALILNNINGHRGFWGWRNGELRKLHDYNWKDLIKELHHEKISNEFGYWLVARREHFAFQDLHQIDEAIRVAKGARQIAKENNDEEAVAHLDAQISQLTKKYQTDKAILDKDGFTEQEVNDAYLPNEERFAPYAEKYDAMVRDDLDFLNDPSVGLISPDEYNQLASKEGYASFKRYFYDELVGEEGEKTMGRVRFGTSKVSSLLKRTGSQKPIVNPLFSALTNHAEITRKGLKQIVSNRIGELASNFPDLFQQVQLQAVPDGQGRMLFPQEKDSNIIMARLNYKRVPFLTDVTIKRTVDEVLNYQNLTIFEKLLMGSSRFFTKGTTGLFPGFALTNYTVDQVTAAAQTRNQYKVLYDPLKTLYKVAQQHLGMNGQNDLTYFQEYLVLGGERQTLVGWQDMSPNELFDRIGKERAGLLKVVDYLNSGMNILAIPSQWSEIATRATEYIKAREAGKPQLVAMEEAGRVTAPFHHIGRWGGGRVGQAYIKSIPFFNPAIQVLAQAAETLETPEGRARYGFVTLAVVASSIGGLGLIMAYGSDDQKREFADKQPDELNKYIWYPLPGGQGLGKLRVPDQMEVFATLINMVWADKALQANYTAGEYVNGALAWLPAQADLSQPAKAFMAWIPQLIKPGVLTLAGVKDFPKIMPLESQSVSNRAPEFRYTQATSPVAKYLGGVLKLSPIKIDYLLTGYVGRASGFLTGKPGIYNPLSSLSSTYYFESGRKIQSFYDKREANDQAYEAYKKGRTDYSLGERSAILKERAKLKIINSTIGLYRDIDEEKNPEKAAKLRTKILNLIDAL